MKRVLFSVVATVVGLVALLGFKTHPMNVTATTISPPHTPSGSSKSPTPTATPSKKGGTPANKGGTPAKTTHRTVDGDAVQTRYGVVQVKVTLQGKKIDQVSFDQMQGYDRRSDEINQNAAPTLVQETLTAQSAHVDTVSGATYTSEGYIQSLQSALDKAGGA
jgi:uncharacterized protein with FMN-binding domain